VLSQIGAHGFLLGRGNQPISPAIIRRIGAGNIFVVSTPAKLARTPVLRFDTGDTALDADMISRKFFTVIIGYHRTRLVKVAA
jgi:predicted polyphosphate/ATP-dependent NAD kinase